VDWVISRLQGNDFVVPTRLQLLAADAAAAVMLFLAIVGSRL
jgi:hypothetical protein